MSDYNKWYGIELNQNEAEDFRQLLYDNIIKCEVSGCFNLVHFEVFIKDEYEYNIVRDWCKKALIHRVLDDKK